MFEPRHIGPLVLSRAEIIAFARRYDPQPFHVDEAAARSSLLGGIVASAWQTSAMLMEMLLQSLLEAGIHPAGFGIEEILWLRPVRPGDVLKGRIEGVSAQSCTCGGQSMKLVLTVVDQHDDVIMRWRVDCAVNALHVEAAPLINSCGLFQHRATRRQLRPIDQPLKGFDEIHEGEQIELGQHAFSDDDIAAFDACCISPIASPARDASAHEGRGLVRPWQLAAAWMKAMVHYYQTEAAALLRAGIAAPLMGPAAGVKHLRWGAPVRPGEQISFRVWAERKFGLASRPEWGLLVVGAEGVNAAGEIVISFYPQMLLERVNVKKDPRVADSAAQTP